MTKNILKYKRIQIANVNSIEIIAIELGDLVLISYYRTFKIAPGSGHFGQYWCAIDIAEQIFTSNPNKMLVFLGDFNLDFKKADNTNYPKLKYFDYFNEKLLHFGFVQLIKNNTWHRCINNELKESLLDHIYVNNILDVINVKNVNENISDHNLVSFEYSNLKTC